MRRRCTGRGRGRAQTMNEVYAENAFGVDQQHSREMFLESFDIIRRVLADENFVFRGKYWTVQKEAPLSPPLVQRPHPPFLVSAQSEESLRWAAQHDIPFAQIDSMIGQAKRDQVLYRAPSRSTTEIARTRQMPLHKQGDDRDRIVFGSQNANALIHRKRRLYLAAAVQDAEYPDARVAARGIA